MINTFLAILEFQFGVKKTIINLSVDDLMLKIQKIVVICYLVNNIMFSPISSLRDGSFLTGKQLVNKIREFKEEHKLKKNLNVSKDKIIVQLLGEIKELKLQVESSDYKLSLNEDLIASQTSVIEDLNTRIERQSSRIKEIEQSSYENQNSIISKQTTISSLASKLDEAKKIIDDQNYALEQYKEKMYDMKTEFENIKKALKERYLERLEQAAKEMEEEREKMNKKLKQTREFYEAEGNDYKRQINQLTEELDLLRRADFNVSKPTPAKGRRRGGLAASRDFSELKVRRARSQASKAKKQDNTKPGCSKETIETSEQETIAGSKESLDKEEIRSLSPMAWLSPNHCTMEDDDNL